MTTSADGQTLTLADRIGYLPFGPVTGLTYGNGLAMQRAYDHDYRLSGLTTGGVQNLAYAYDPAGNVTNIDDLLDALQDRLFVYDELDRLTHATDGSGALDYGYDAVGNRLSLYDGRSQTDYGYAPDSQRLVDIIGVTTQTRSYDAAGNTVQSAAGQFGYDEGNRLSLATVGALQAAYGYNGRGERVRKSLDGRTTHYRYDREGRLIGEYDDQGNPSREYVYLQGEPLVVIESGSGGDDRQHRCHCQRSGQLDGLGEHERLPGQ